VTPFGPLRDEVAHDKPRRVGFARIVEIHDVVMPVRIELGVKLDSVLAHTPALVVSG
jgi:hypothetical protein